MMKESVFDRMAKRIGAVFIFFVIVLAGAGCSGLNFSFLAPEAVNFHPRRIALFPIEVWNHKEEDARAVLEPMVAGLLVRKKRFAYVLDPDALQKISSEQEGVAKIKEEYLTKLRQLAFSDPDLSRAIGEAVGVDAFLFLYVDEWKYAGKGDKKVAEVRLSMEMYEAATGKLMWKAWQSDTKDFLLIKPLLTDMALGVADKMIDDMPY